MNGLEAFIVRAKAKDLRWRWRLTCRRAPGRARHCPRKTRLDLSRRYFGGTISWSGGRLQAGAPVWAMNYYGASFAGDRIDAATVVA